MTQKDLADQIGIHANSLSNYERGRDSIKAAIFYRLCTALDQRPEEVVGSVMTILDTSQKKR